METRPLIRASSNTSSSVSGRKTAAVDQSSRDRSNSNPIEDLNIDPLETIAMDDACSTATAVKRHGKFDDLPLDPGETPERSCCTMRYCGSAPPRQTGDKQGLTPRGSRSVQAEDVVFDTDPPSGGESSFYEVPSCAKFPGLSSAEHPVLTRRESRNQHVRRCSCHPRHHSTPPMTSAP